MSISRRYLFLLPLFLLVFVFIFALASDSEKSESRQEEIKPYVFITHGPFLGRPGPSQMGVWARTSTPGTFRVIYGKKPESLVFSSEPIQTALSNDNTGWVVLKDLEPNTKYYYAVVTDSEVPTPKNRGTFHTFPQAEQYREAEHNPRGLFNFSFEIGCGNAQNEEYSLGPYMDSFETMVRNLRDRIQFAIQHGDFIYEDQREFSLEQWMKEQAVAREDLPEILQIAPTITGVWENYKIYYERSSNLAEWHRHIPSYFIFDDHEIINDVLGVVCLDTAVAQPVSGISVSKPGMTMSDGAIPSPFLRIYILAKHV